MVTYIAHYTDGTTKKIEYEGDEPELEHLYEMIGTDIVTPLPYSNYKVWIDENASFKDVERNKHFDCLGTAVELIDCEMK